MQELGQHLADRAAVRHVLLAQLMDLDRAHVHRRARPHESLVGLARENARAADLDRRDADDVVRQDVEAAGLAVERDDFAADVRPEQERIGVVGEKHAVEPRAQPSQNLLAHQNTLK